MPRLKNRLIKLFISYLLLLLPVFLVYLFMTQSILNTLRMETDSKSQAQLQQLNDEFTHWYQSYSDTSTMLSVQQELLRYRMLQNEIFAQKGIEALANVKAYNADIFDIFMYYDTEKIYSARGLSKYYVYFGNTLGCTETSVFETAEILTNPNNGVYLLEQTAESGYLLYHFPVRFNTEGAFVSVNVLMKVSVLRNSLEQLLKNCDTYISVIFADGKELCFYGNGQISDLAIVRDGLVGDLSAFTMHSIRSDELGTTISVYYQSDTLYKDINQKQLLSYGVMAVLLLVSVLTSYIVSRRFHTPIHNLATQIASHRKKDASFIEGKKKNTDELEYLKKTFDLMVDESKQMSRGLNEYRIITRPLTAMLLFHGMVKDAVLINRLFELCDYEFYEDYYVIIGVDLPRIKKEGERLDALENYFEDDLFCNATVGNRKIFTVLVNIPNPDYLGKIRQKIEENIRDLCHKYEGNILIGFSRVYKDGSMISNAYIEAVSAVEYLSGEGAEETVFYEKMPYFDSFRQQLNEETLERLEEALKRQDYDSASASLYKLLYSVELNSKSKEINRYIRYSALQRAIKAIKEDQGGQIDAALLTQAMHIDPTDEENFADEMNNLAKLICFTKEKEDVIQKAIEYLERNFSRNDLSLDEVAEYVGLTKTYLSKLFRQRTGNRYIDYLSKLRLEEAKRLLRETDSTIKVIVENIGYYDVPRFRKKFKSMYGINAFEYRKKSDNTDGIEGGNNA